MEKTPCKMLNTTCKAAMALYSHYIALDMDEKAMDQAFHIYNTWNVLVQDYVDDLEIIALENMMFGTVEE